MGKHTPGPWLLVDTGDDDEIWIGVNHPDAGIVTHASVRYGCDESRELGDVTNNARLIAAVPDLLEALIAILPDAEANHVGGPDTGARIDVARSAIAKATRESP